MVTYGSRHMLTEGTAIRQEGLSAPAAILVLYYKCPVYEAKVGLGWSTAPVGHLGQSTSSASAYLPGMHITKEV